MSDPLSLATWGRFTSSSYKNMQPITLTTFGHILQAESDEGTGAGAGYPIIFYHPEKKALVSEKSEKSTDYIDGIEIEETKPSVLVQQPPLTENIEPIGDLLVDRELVKELRSLAILEHQLNEIEIQLEIKEKFKLYRKRKHLMLALMMDEM